MPAELAADRREYRRGEPVRLRVRFADEREAPVEDDGVTVVLEREGRKNERINLHRNASQPRHLRRHDHRCHRRQVSRLDRYADTRRGRAVSRFSRDGPARARLERVQMDAAELKRAAEETRGRFYRIGDVDRLLDDLPPGHQVPIEIAAAAGSVEQMVAAGGVSRADRVGMDST